MKSVSGVQRIEFNGIGIIQAQSRHTTTLDPLAVFEEIMKHMPQLDIQDRNRDNLHRVGPENLTCLCGHLAGERWHRVAAWPSSPTGQGAGKNLLDFIWLYKFRRV